jgi:hypothetical protein
MEYALDKLRRARCQPRGLLVMLMKVASEGPRSYFSSSFVCHVMFVLMVFTSDELRTTIVE